jgi:two-component system, OmpR family, phosphate regulon sensor histidine kinase PhoR
MENGHSPKILIVDDEKGLRVGTKRLLEGEGYFVETAENGYDGIKLGTTTEFDLAILDLKMPDIDGIQVMKEILKVYPDTVCLIATGYASYETAVEAIKLGAFSYIPKPFTPEELFQKLTEGYSRRELIIEKKKWKQEREERLLEVAFEKSRLNTIINSITDGLLVVNKNGEAVLFNPSALKYLGFDQIKIEEYIIDRLHPQIADLINKFFSVQTCTQKSFSSQVELKPNHELFVEATSSPVFHPDGTLAGVVVVIKDITELKKIEFLKSQFVSMVSHELKAPVAAVYGYLSLFSDPSIHLSDEQKHNYIIRSQIRLDGLLKMVNDLLDISRMELRSVKKEIKEIDILAIIKSVIELFQIEIKKKNISVNIKVPENLPLLNADQDEVGRLFTNLISNAIKYNKTDGSIDVIINLSGNYIITEVKDTGIGLKMAEKEKLFQEFFRAKNEKTKDISGTGLGLSIVKRIVDSYSGKLEVESEFNIGTSFKIFLPLRNGNNITEQKAG